MDDVGAQLGKRVRLPPADLASSEPLTDEQLDMLLPSDGYEVVAASAADRSNSSTSTDAQQHGTALPQDPLTFTVAQVEEYFVSRLGPAEDAFDRMRTMSIPELEDLQGVADDISSGGAGADSQRAGLAWSTKISTFIA